MRKFYRLGVSVILLLMLCACGQKDTAPTWQEQYDLGIRYLSEGNYEEAIIAFTAAIEIDPKRPEGYSGLAKAYMGMDDQESALAILEAGIAETGAAELNALLAELQTSTTTPPEAPDEAYDDAWEAYTAGVEAYFSGSYHEALELLDTAIAAMQSSSTYSALKAANIWSEEQMEEYVDGMWDLALMAGAAARVCYAIGDTDSMQNYFFLAETHMYLGPPYYNNGFYDAWGGINITHPVSDTGQTHGAIYSLLAPREDGGGDPEVLIELHFDENGEQIIIGE